MGNSNKHHKIRHHSKKRGGKLVENTDGDVDVGEVDVGEVDVGEMEMEAEAEAPVKPVAVKKPVSVAAKPVVPVADAPAADAPVAKGKCCPCPDESEGLLKKLSPKKQLDNLEAGILNTHALVGKMGTAKAAELKEGLQTKVLGLTSKINEKVGNKAAAPAAAPAVEEVAPAAAEEETQSGGRRRRRRSHKVKKGRKSKKRGKSKKGRKTKRTRKTKRY